MPGFIFDRISGVKGEVTIPALGTLIGTMQTWELTRHASETGSDEGRPVGLYDLRAVFSYVNPHLFSDEDYTKEIIVVLGRTKQFRVLQTNGEVTVLTGRTLLMKGVKLDAVQGAASH